MAKNISDKKQSGLSSWFFKEPAKFSILAFASVSCAAIFYALISGIFFGYDTPPPITPSVMLMMIALVFAIYKLIKWLPAEKLDRRSFVAIENGVTMIYFLFAAIFGVIAIAKIPDIALFVMGLQSHSIILFFVAAIVLSLVYMYAMGIMVASMYAMYLRARAIGVPKWKVLMSFPFTFLMFLLPGYILGDAGKKNVTIQIKSKWYTQLTDWVMASMPNTLLALLVIVLFSSISSDFYVITSIIIFAAIFAIWAAIVGLKTFAKNIGGAYSSVAASINIAILVIMIALIIMSMAGMHGVYSESVMMIAG